MSLQRCWRRGTRWPSRAQIGTWRRWTESTCAATQTRNTTWHTATRGSCTLFDGQQNDGGAALGKRPFRCETRGNGTCHSSSGNRPQLEPRDVVHRAVALHLLKYYREDMCGAVQIRGAVEPCRSAAYLLPISAEFIVKSIIASLRSSNEPILSWRWHCTELQASFDSHLALLGEWHIRCKAADMCGSPNIIYCSVQLCSLVVIL